MHQTTTAFHTQAIVALTEHIARRTHIGRTDADVRFIAEERGVVARAAAVFGTRTAERAWIEFARQIVVQFDAVTRRVAAQTLRTRLGVGRARTTDVAVDTLAWHTSSYVAASSSSSAILLITNNN